ncbi:MAG: GNAT family N-acetyltransferase [Lachnospiraceae bacterium]|nr:GNAT family N-acetyltransferase [Lachnospiraceae bacterium]MDO4966927.1 GNAT family N-acetyltransferase [Lachnospiraceae bacterium]
MMEFRNYKKNDYDALIDFLVQLSNEDMNHINWNWARFEWMIEHPDTDKLSLEKIGLWWEKGNIVGAAIYDMYLGEAFCGTLKTHMDILPEILDYAYRIFKDENGLGIAIRNEDLKAIEKAIDLGFEKVNQTENVMMLGLDNIIPSRIPADIVIREYNPAENPREFAWLLWQGFNHGNDQAEFESKDSPKQQLRKHLDKRLSLSAVDSSGNIVGYVCLWHSPETDYAYVEPVCTIPEFRNMGISKALLTEAFSRVNKLGAKKAIVISDMDFYKKLGFVNLALFSFYWKL